MATNFSTEAFDISRGADAWNANFSQRQLEDRFTNSRAPASDGASILSDAAEELCLFVSEKVEHKSLDEREIDGESRLDAWTGDQLSKYLSDTNAFRDPKKLANLVRAIWAGEVSPRELALRSDCSRSEAYALLQLALQDGMSHGARTAVLDELRETLVELELHHGAEIRSCLNTIGATSEFGRTRDKVLAFQQTYQDVVLAQPSLAKTLNILLERLSGLDGDDFQRGLHGLIRALGQDLSALRPSCDVNRLQLVIQDLYHLEVATTFIEGCKAASADLARRHGNTAIKPLALMQDLVSITDEKWVVANRFRSLAQKFGAIAPSTQIAFLSTTLSLMRSLPVKVYPNTDARWKILGASQEALDGAIDAEEAEAS